MLGGERGQRNATGTRYPFWIESRLGDFDAGNIHASSECIPRANPPTHGFKGLEQCPTTRIWHESSFDTFLSRYGTP